MKPARRAPDALADPALPKKETMGAARAVDAMGAASAVVVAACDPPGHGRDSSAVSGAVASLKLPLDPPIDAIAVNGAKASDAAARKYAGNGNDDGSDEEKVADHLKEVDSKKRVYDRDFDPYDTDSDVEYDYNTDNSVDKRNHASFTKKVLKELNEGRHKLVDKNGDYTCPFGCPRIKDGRESSLANHANSIAMSNAKTFKERSRHKALAHFFFGDKLPDYSMKRNKNRY
ncbi:hypothetical protein ACQ4PT_021069 [Festuca glaucescens]